MLLFLVAQKNKQTTATATATATAPATATKKKGKDEKRKKKKKTTFSLAAGHVACSISLFLCLYSFLRSDHEHTVTQQIASVIFLFVTA
jgi:hypothetical protein